jgi:hypothetical protein
MKGPRVSEYGLAGNENTPFMIFRKVFEMLYLCAKTEDGNIKQAYKYNIYSINMIKRKPLLLLFFLLKELSALNIGNKIIDVVKQRMLPSLVSSNEALGRRDFGKDITFVVTTSLSVLFRPEEAHATRAVGRFFFKRKFSLQSREDVCR